MGHNTLGVLPKTKSWNQVVDALDRDASDDEVVARSAKAAETSLQAATRDPVFLEAFHLLLNLPIAARSDDFGDALRQLDLDVRQRPSMPDLLISISQRLEDITFASQGLTDLGDLASRAVTRTLDHAIGSEIPTLFAATPDDVQAALRKYSSSSWVAQLTRSFFGELVAETLTYNLRRALPLHIGEGRKFENAAATADFDLGLRQLVFETTRIIREFSGGWYGKRISERGSISKPDAQVFGAVCVKKIISELQRRVDNHA